MFLFYRDKIEHSTVISQKEIKKKYLPISTSKQRIISLVTYILMSLYTIYTCIILRLNANEISLFVIANIISLSSMILIKIISKSVYELNHQKTYLVIDFINKLSKVILFYYAITKFIDAFDMILFNETLNSNIDLIEVIRTAIVNKEPQSIQLLQTLWTNDILPAISLLVSVLTFIPILLYFFVINIKMICTVIVWITPGINVITFLYWIFKKHDVFKVYKVKNDETYICETRKINIRGYNANIVLTKLFFSALIIGFIVFTITFVFKLNTLVLIKNFYLRLYDYILDILYLLTGYSR